MALSLTSAAPDPRLAAIVQWLHQLPVDLGVAPDTLAPASSDASFRRYFRVEAAAERTYIVMDAPPDKEDCRPFIDVAHRLREASVHAPQVLAIDLAQGFLLLEDFGKLTYFTALQAAGLDSDETGILLRDALSSLVRLQGARADGLPLYDVERLQTEMALFPHWYVQRHLGQTLSADEQAMLSDLFDQLSQHLAALPGVLTHRDFHSRNLMVCQPGQPGILDFQDAVVGPLSYDLVSLMRDAYIAWDEPRQLDACARYWESARAAQLPVPLDFGDFYRDFEWMGLQRHLKVLGIFARLAHRDGKAGYLNDIPLVWAYTRRTAARYRLFNGLLRLMDRLEGSVAIPQYTF